MSLESGVRRLDEFPTIPSSMDPISTNSTFPLPLASARVAAVSPKRTRSLSIGGKPISEGDDSPSRIFDEWKGRSASSIRANVKRGRSVASAPGDSPGPQSLRTDNSARPISRGRPHLDNEAPLGPSRKRESTKQQELSRGRTIRRANSYPDNIESRKRRKVDGGVRPPGKSVTERTESIKNTLRVSEGPERIIMAPLPLTEMITHSDSGENVVYEQRGAFKLKKSKGVDEFRFPKSLSQPEPIWRAGDGFSSDEAKPDFMFLVNSTHKQRGSGSLPGIGKLQLEVENVNKENLRSSGISRPKTQHLSQYAMTRRRGAVKDVWPTRENFSEELEVRKRNPTVPENEKIIPSTLLPQPTPEPRPREIFTYNPLPLRARKHSDFEHFGQRLRGSGELSTTRDAEPRNMEVFHMGQLEPGDNTECEYEEEYEAGEDDEFVLATNYDEELDEAEEHITSHEDASNASRSRESSTNHSAIFISNGETDELQADEQHPNGNNC
ncbi:hypothetical protein F5Y13DRAFT_204283 [Hypoxylon sp. FL1857]|nr:hypothetical protein F5Y13DRAFT_204283 [Hypoxylon sp. FL1857]